MIVFRKGKLSVAIASYLMSITTFLVRRSSLYGRRYLVYLMCFPFTFGGWRLSGAFEPVTTSQIIVVVLSRPNRLIESLFGWNLSRFGFLSLFLSDSLPPGTQKMYTHTHTHVGSGDEKYVFPGYWYLSFLLYRLLHSQNLSTGWFHQTSTQRCSDIWKTRPKPPTSRSKYLTPVFLIPYSLLIFRRSMLRMGFFLQRIVATFYCIYASMMCVVVACQHRSMVTCMDAFECYTYTLPLFA